MYIYMHIYIYMCIYNYSIIIILSLAAYTGYKYIGPCAWIQVRSLKIGAPSPLGSGTPLSTRTGVCAR